MKFSPIKIAQQFKRYYKVFSLSIYGLTIFALFWVLIAGNQLAPFRFLGKKFGDIAVICFCLSLVPGIARRLKMKNTAITILGLVRPQLGKLMFVFVVFHMITLRLIPSIKFGVEFPSLFEIFGWLAFLLTLPLYLTSNPQMTARLGKNWKRLHRLVYIIVWLVFLHLAFGSMNLSFWLVTPTAIVELMSLFVEYIQKRAIVEKQQDTRILN